MKGSKLLAIVVIALIVVSAFATTTIIQAQADNATSASLDTSMPSQNILGTVEDFQYVSGSLLGLKNHAPLAQPNHIKRGNPNFGVDYIIISPKSAVTVAGQSQLFTATAYNYGGHGHDVSTLPDTTWSIDSGAGTYVWTDNSVQVTKAGTWTVTVTYKGHTDTASLVVTHADNGKLDHITAAVNPTSVEAQKTVIGYAEAFDVYGNSWDVSTLATWSIPAGGDGGFWSQNVYTSKNVGVYTVEASYEGKTATASLTVTSASGAHLDHITASVNPTTVAAPNSVTGTATAYDTLGHSWDVSTLATWSVPAGNDGGSWMGNIYTSKTAGTYTVQAAYEGKTASATLTVSHATDQAFLDHITIAPKTATVNVGQAETYTATAYDTFGNSWGVTAVYTCPDANLVISGSSAYSNTANSYTVIGKYGGKSDTATLTVTGHLENIVSLTVTPKTASISAGSPQSFKATASDGYNTWDVTSTVAWSIDVAAGGSWAQTTGTYTSTIAGSWTVKATLGALSDSAILTVNANPALLDHIVISPKAATVLAGTSQNFTVAAFDKFGNSLGDVTSSAIFAANGASVTANSVSTNNVGSYSVTATYSGFKDTASLTVTGYAVTYTQRGLPTGTNWNITFGNIVYSSTTDTITITGVSAIAYSWSTSSFIRNDQTRYAAAQTSGTLFVPGKTTQTIDYSTQYLVSYTATGDALSVAVPSSEWINSGSTATGTFLAQVTNTAGDTKCNFIGDNRTQTITAPTIISATYQTQYLLSVTSTHNTASGAGWYNAGALATVWLNSGVSLVSSGAHYVFTGWSGDASGSSLTSQSIVMDRPKTANANWKIGYLVTYAVVGNVLPIGAPLDEWVVLGASAQGKFVQTSANLANDTQCLFQSDDRPVIITKPTTITATYQTQYKVTFDQTGIESDADGPIAQILGVLETSSQLPMSIWVNSSTTVDFIFNSTVAGATANEVYTLIGVNATSPLTIDQPTVILASYLGESNVSLYSILEVALILFAVTLTTIMLLRYRRNRIRKQQNITVAANPNS